MAIGYYMAVPMSVDKSGVLFRVYSGIAQPWRLALIEILQPHKSDGKGAVAPH